MENTPNSTEQKKENNTPDPKETLSKPPKVEMVSITKDAWDKVLGTISELEKDRDILKEVADKGRLDRVERLRSEGKLVKTVGITTLKGKKVVGWRTITNTLDYDVRGVAHEDQVVEVTYEDKSKEEMRLVQKARNAMLIYGEVIKESKDEDGRTSYVVRFEDGSTLEISETFIN